MPDLNLLVTLDAVLRERSVTKAAERLGVSQPAVSAALARLRVHFGDELIYRTSGNTYDFTPLAVSLAARTPAALQSMEDIFAVEASFDPGSCDREFVIICSDYGSTVIGAPVAAELALVAPGMRLRLTQTSLDPFTEDRARLRSVDGIIMPHGFIDGQRFIDLVRDRWVCVISARCTSVGDRLTLQDLGRLPWVTNFPHPWAGGALRQLAELGVPVHVQVQVDTFLRVPQFVAGTDRIALMPYRLARLALPRADLRIMECPFDVHPSVHALWWDPVFDRDPEHAWLRGQFAAISLSAQEASEAPAASS